MRYSKKTGIGVLLALAAAMLFSACGAPVIPEDTSTGTEMTEMTEASVWSETGEVNNSGLSHSELCEVMAVSVTDGGLPTDREAVFARFADLAASGVTSVRVDTSWNTEEKGVWKMSETTKNYLEAAEETGLMLKLILPTVMAPPAWLSADEDTRLRDQNGRLSVNTVSYWYGGITEYSEEALKSQLSAIVDGGWGDIVCGIVVDMGPAGEPLYPPAWTQVASGLDLGGGAEVMWCYGDNAEADFRKTMQAQYGDISLANAAWGTEYASFEEVEVPRPGERSGTMWEDTLKWYYLTKRGFMSAQVDVFLSVTEELGLEEVPLILYLPGADVTQSQWDGAISGGTAVGGIMMACDNRFTAELARDKGCVLQYTGINDAYSLGLLRSYMFEAGLENVPIFGENAGDAVSASNIEGLGNTVVSMKLWGIDYTHTRWLYKQDGVTRSESFDKFQKTAETVKNHVETAELTSPPEPSGETSESPAPGGKILRMDIDFRKPGNEPLAYIFFEIETGPVTLCPGDTLEYDVLLSEPMQGLGAVDGAFMTGETLRDSFGISDTLGIRAHPNADLSALAYPEWHHRVLNIGNPVSEGKVLTSVLLAAHPEQADGAFDKKSVTVYYDNIVIKRGGEVIARIFDEDSQVSAELTNVKYARGTVTVTDLGAAAGNE